jgi:hypothetical protein
MNAYKFLAHGGKGRFSDYRWPLPAEGGFGDWVDAGEELEDCRTGVHACTPRQLLGWIDDELWEIELDGEIIERDAMIVAQRGRLLARVTAWDEATAQEFADACAWRARTFVFRGLRRLGLTEEAERLSATPELAELQTAAVAAVEGTDGAAAELAAFAADTVSLVQGRRPEMWDADAHPGLHEPERTPGAIAANLAFVVAQAAGREAAAAGSEADYGPGFEAERDWQLAWLTAQLGLRAG